ncbi:hypothetical protein WA1_11830 [Scytonema hofmannii PCC 7110]|jgi:hypothetical protein|uniref:Addiction module component n=1 Tax=Scytonema hofmannii PCC 7110 TaxID=128403 RepID=A0A139XDN3_9CYAN|nr:hypothetical protein [Scytonema hofmannii]KYC42811.1 hypothetical protein WA1_11830 [Scytonema hofmannii PCC 7110]
MTELLRKVVAKIEQLPEEKQNEIAERWLAELERESSEKLLLEQLASTEAVVWSPYDAHEAAQTLGELLAKAKQEDNA